MSTKPGQLQGSGAAGFEARVEVLGAEVARELSPLGAAVAVEWRGVESSGGVVDVELDVGDFAVGSAMVGERLRVTGFRSCVSEDVEFDVVSEAVGGVVSEGLSRVDSRTRVVCGWEVDVPIVDSGVGWVTVRVDLDELDRRRGDERGAAERAGTGRVALEAALGSEAQVRVVSEPVAVEISTEWASQAESAGLSSKAGVESLSSGGVILAMSSSSAGPSGDFGALPVPLLGAADVGPYSGSAEYVYDIEVPAPAAGAAPSVSLVYSSASVDGLNTQSNTQVGGVGVGWSLAAGGSITREWGNCGVVEPGHSNPNELCDAGDRYVLTLNGRGSRLIAEGTANEFRLEDDPHWRVLRKFTASGTGDSEGEWWEVTTPDGTVYEFGRDAARQSVASGWVSSTSACSGAALCRRGWQWALDEARDTNGNEIVYSYTPEYNYYQFWGSSWPSNPASGYRVDYIRALQLDSIYYTNGSGPGSGNARIMFRWETRCDIYGPGYEECDPLDFWTATRNYPDTPLDLWCRNGAKQTTCLQDGQSFWSGSRLGSIQTQVWRGGSDWNTVATHDLAQSFPEPPADPQGDLSEAKLALLRIHRRPGTGTTYLGIDQIEAEDYMSSNGGVAPYAGPTTGDLDNPVYVGSFSVGDWFKIEDVDLGASSWDPDQVLIRYGSPHDSTIEIRAGSSTGALLATVSLPATGGWELWETVRVNTTAAATSFADVVVVGKTSTSGTETANVNWIRFASSNPGNFLAWPSLPPTDFYSTGSFEWLDNRVFGAALSGVSPMTAARIGTILNPLGGTTTFTYHNNVASVDCPNWPVGWDDNSRICYPLADPFSGPGTWDMWWKRLVVQVDRDDGFNPVVTTAYTYQQPAWAFYDAVGDGDTWNEFRGYNKVTIDVGPTNGLHSSTEMRFFQGMNEDHYESGAQKYSLVAFSDGSTIADHRYWRGRPYEIRSLDTANQPLSATRTLYTGAITTSAPGDKAYFVAPTLTRDISYVPGTDLETRVYTNYDIYGNVANVTEAGEINTTGDERYTDYDYAINTTGWIINTACQVQVWDDDDGNHGGNSDMVSRTRYYYDGGGYCSAPTDGDVSTVDVFRTATGSIAATSIVTDSKGRVTRVTDPLGNDTNTGYDPSYGSVAWTGNDAGHVTTYGYDTFRRLVSTTGPNPGQDTSVLYDGYGNVTTTESPLQTLPSSFDLRITQLNQSGTVPSKIIQFEFIEPGKFAASVTYLDGFGRPLQTQTRHPQDSPWERQVSFTSRDNRGLSERASIPYQYSGDVGTSFLVPTWSTVESHTQTVYDEISRPVAQQLRSNTTMHSETTFAYDGNQTVITDPEGNPRRETYDAYGNLTLAETGTSYLEQTLYVYDAANQISRVMDDQFNLTMINYDVAGQKTSLNDPDTGIWGYTYDNAGNLITQSDGDGTVLWHAYDNLNRLTEQRLANSGGQLLANYSYDSAFKGAPDTATSHEPAGAVTHNIASYNPAGQPTAENWVIPGPAGGNFATTNTYTDAGLIKTVRYPANDTGGLGETLTYGYWGRAKALKSITSDNGTNYVRQVTYDTNGRLSNLTYHGYSNYVTRSVNYDPVTQQRTAVWDLASNFQTPMLRAMGYDLVGNITRLTQVSSVTPMQHECPTYDHLNRLDTSELSTDFCATNSTVGFNWNHNSIGNVTLSHRAGILYYGAGTAGPHAVTSTSSGDSFTYNTDGNMTIRDLAGPGSQTLTYSDHQRLETLNDGATTTTYSYDTNGIRVLADNGTETTLTLAGVYERTVTNTTGATTTETYYYTGPEGLVAMNVDGELTYLFTDNRGGIDATWNPTTQQISNQIYEPYGTIRTNGNFDTTIGYTGQRADDTGLMYYNARYYDPYLGRFAQPDTIIPNPTNPQDLNRYSYVNNNPINNSDPTGHVCYSSGPNKGRCYEGADGEGSAQTSEEEVSTVKILANETFDPNGSIVAARNVRYTEFGGLTGQQIIDSRRNSDLGSLSGSARNQAFVEGLVLDRDGTRITVGHLTRDAAVRFAQNVAVGAAAIAFASAVCTTGVGCIAVAGFVAGGATNVLVADPLADCAVGNCHIPGPTEAGVNAINGGVTGATAALIGSNTASAVGANRSTIGLIGALRTTASNDGYRLAPGIVSGVVVSQAPYRGAAAGLRSLVEAATGSFQ